MITDIQKQIGDEVNRVRATHSLPPLQISDALCNSSQSFSEYMAKKEDLDHDLEWARKNSGGEIVAKSFSPKGCVNQWYTSKTGHKEIMLSTRYTVAGFAAVQGLDRFWYCTGRLIVGIKPPIDPPTPPIPPSPKVPNWLRWILYFLGR